MAVVRRLPYRTHFGLEQQMREMERIMNAIVGNTQSQRGRSGQSGDDNASGDRSSSVSPAVDVYRDDEHLVMEFELPGVDVENDVDVEISDGILTVKGARRSERDEERNGMYLQERRVGSFSRSLSLPEGVESDAIEADYTDGVLCIRVPMPDEDEQQRKPRKVEITSGKAKPQRKAIDSKSTEKKSADGASSNGDSDSSSKAASAGKRSSGSKSDSKAGSSRSKS